MHAAGRGQTELEPIADALARVLAPLDEHPSARAKVVPIADPEERWSDALMLAAFPRVRLLCGSCASCALRMRACGIASDGSETLKLRGVVVNALHEVRDEPLEVLDVSAQLRACDLTKLRVRDVCHGVRVASRATIMQQKTQRPVQFEITEQTRESVEAWMKQAGLQGTNFLFPSRIHDSPHLSTREYARLVHRWIVSIGLDDTAYGTHTMRRTKASLIYRRTKNLRAVQLLLGHTKLESTVRYLGIEVDDALEMAEQTEV